MNLAVKVNLALITIISSLSMSCVSLPKPLALTSTPPIMSMKLDTPAVWGDGILLKKYTFPVGIYKAQSQDAEGFYYQSSDSLKVNDSFLTYGATGGLYLRKGQVSPDQMYVLSPLGGALKVQPKNGPLKVSNIKR